MKLQQLRFVLAIAECGLNITQASLQLFTSQPGVSKQLRLLEEELDIQIFARNGKNLVSITPEGKVVLDKAKTIMSSINEIKAFSNSVNPERRPFPIQNFTHTA